MAAICLKKLPGDTTKPRNGVPLGGVLSTWWYIKIGMGLGGFKRVFNLFRTYSRLYFSKNLLNCEKFENAQLEIQQHCVCSLNLQKIWCTATGDQCPENHHLNNSQFSQYKLTRHNYLMVGKYGILLITTQYRIALVP